MTPAIDIETVETRSEYDAILAWRLWVLDRAGYDAGAAALLAGSRDVDLHAAVELLERGCPVDTALRILL